MNPSVEAFRFDDDRGGFPNSRLPVLVYRGVDDREARFRRHGWTGAWRNGIYPFDHGPRERRAADRPVAARLGQVLPPGELRGRRVRASIWRTFRLPEYGGLKRGRRSAR